MGQTQLTGPVAEALADAAERTTREGKANETCMATIEMLDIAPFCTASDAAVARAVASLKCVCVCARVEVWSVGGGVVLRLDRFSLAFTHYTTPRQAVRPARVPAAG